MEDWKEYKLGDICSIYGRIGFRGYTKDDFVTSPKEGAITLSPSNIIDGEIDLSKVDYISWEKYNESPEIMLNKGDIVLSKTGTIGRIAIIRNLNHPITLNPQLVVLKDIKINPEFLAFYLKTPFFQGLLKSITVGSVVSTLSQKNLTNLKLKLPNSKIQNKVADILLSFVHKIEVNRRINENLEQQAQALFKSWFVDFEPFRDGVFVESELGMIPKGWRVVTLNDFAVISKSSINPQKQKQTVFFHYSIPSYDEGMNPEIQLGEEIKSNKFVISNKMTLFSKLNPRIKRVWYVDNLLPNSVCSTEFVPYKAKEVALSSFLHGLINSQRFYDFVLTLVNGATGSHQRFHPEDSLKYQIAYNKDYIKNYCLLANPFLNQILTNNEESRRLATLRDTLLPRLMSGELNINELEKSL